MSTVNPDHSVLLLGGTGRTGGRVLTKLLERGVPVRAIVRSAGRLPPGLTDDSLLSVVEADVLSLTPEELQRCLEGCDTVISCLGHNANLRGVFGPPFSIAAGAASNVAHAVEAMHLARSVRFILMSTVAANLPGKAEGRLAEQGNGSSSGPCAPSCRQRGTISGPRTSLWARSGRATPRSSGSQCVRTRFSKATSPTTACTTNS